MALVVNDRVKESTAVVGTGTATLLGAALGFQSFAVVGNGNTTYYCIADQGGANWEVGLGTYTLSGTTLARTTVLSSSNAGALVSFTSGTKDVFVTYPSERSVHQDAAQNVTMQKNISVGAAAPTTSGTGITYPSTASPSTDANTLDDYEEGTFTPTLTGFTGTGITATANYTKIGRVVWCSVTIAPSSGNITGAAMSITQPFVGTSYGTGTWIVGGASQTGGIQAVPFGNEAALSGTLTAAPLVNLGWFMFCS
jgi:hypothetical protein